MKKWLYGAPLALCVVLLAAVLWQSQKLDALNTEISSLTAALEQQAQETSGLREQVEELQHSVPEGPALTDWSVAPVSVDPDRRELTVRVSVTPAEGRDIRWTGPSPTVPTWTRRRTSSGPGLTASTK